MFRLFKKNYLLAVILFAAFLVRIYALDFPDFTSEEARIAYRGFTISTKGEDELSRFFPVIFNSLKDYQLPVVSYLASGGELIFGKNDLGVRIPFILTGTLLIFLIYKIAGLFSEDKLFQYISAGTGALAPSLIFLSKVPNETIVLTFLIALLFYLLVKRKNIFLILAVMILSLLTSKLVWFIIFPLTYFTVTYFLTEITFKKKVILIASSAILAALTFGIFFNIPQGQRSLIENNFSLFSDITIKNGIDRLRGQGLESGWPALLDRALFNKSYFLIVGLIQWLTLSNPSYYFGQLDSKGLINFSYLGSVSKVMIFPALLGIFFIIRNPNRKPKSLVFLILILTLPAFLNYPLLSLELSVLALIFVLFIISFGLLEMGRFNRKILYGVIFLMIFELILNLYNLSSEQKNTNNLRPGWIKVVVSDIVNLSETSKAAISDNLVDDIAPMVYWYSAGADNDSGLRIPWPYKFREYKLGNITVIGSEEKFRGCGKTESLTIFASSRDLSKIQALKNIEIKRKYGDFLNEDRIFTIEGICLN